jgi:hypothetical protein
MMSRNVASWHEPDQPGRSVDVRCSVSTGSGWQTVKTAHPKRALAAPVGIEPEVGLTHLWR